MGDLPKCLKFVPWILTSPLSWIEGKYWHTSAFLILCDDFLQINFIRDHVKYSIKWRSFYCTCFLRLTRGNNSLIDLLLCSVWLCFLKAARARIFFFLKASASICKNSLLVTRGAIFWNTITFKHPHRAKMNDGLEIWNWARFMN